MTLYTAVVRVYHAVSLGDWSLHVTQRGREAQTARERRRRESPSCAHEGKGHEGKRPFSRHGLVASTPLHFDSTSLLLHQVCVSVSFSVRARMCACVYVYMCTRMHVQFTHIHVHAHKHPPTTPPRAHTHTHACFMELCHNQVAWQGEEETRRVQDVSLFLATELLTSECRGMNARVHVACVCVCAYVCVCVCVCACVCVSLSFCVSLSVGVYTNVYVHVHIHIVRAVGGRAHGATDGQEQRN